MKKKILAVLIFTLGGTVLVVAVFLGYLSFSFSQMERKMKVGKEFMENLSDEELAYWIRDAKTVRAIDVLKARGMNTMDSLDKASREKYSKLGIIRLDVSDREVSYVWMGGLDHTELTFRFKKDSLVLVTANYNDYVSQELYPHLKDVFFSIQIPKAKEFGGNKILSSRSENN